MKATSESNLQPISETVRSFFTFFSVFQCDNEHPNLATPVGTRACVDLRVFVCVYIRVH